MNTRHASRSSRQPGPAGKTQRVFLLSATIYVLALWSVLASPLTVIAANSIAVRIICDRVFVADAEVKLYRIGANGERQAAGGARTDKKGKAQIRNFDSGTYELEIVCADGAPITYKFSVGAGEAFSHSYSFRCCPPNDTGPNGLTGVDGRFPTDAETANSTMTSKPEVTATSGLKTITFNTDSGRVRVNLPDDVRAGDKISGTVIPEPKGNTDEERTKNGSVLNGFSIWIGGQRIPVSQGPFGFQASKQAPQVGEMSGEGKLDISFGPSNSSGTGLTRASVLLPLSGAIIDPKTTDPPFAFPLMGQTGRPIVITGPFDGNSSNTQIDFKPTITIPAPSDAPTKLVQNWTSCALGAESPRQAVVTVPANVTGPIEIRVKEGTTETTAPFRNVGVKLSAPKTNLLKGDNTTLTVQVSGLEGIKEPVPLTLTYGGVIIMEGGPYQPLVIQPSQVGADGRYTTTRGITGVQTGGWEATATVVTGRFNVWLQDDSDPNRLFHFNSFTGDYIFACGGGSCRSGTAGTSSQPPTGSTEPPPPVTLTGIGRPAMKGCIITLSHNAPDRRVFARLDACTKSGDASVQTNSPKAEFKITDKNTADNTAGSPPK